MPFKKRNKRATYIKQAIKRRLIEISIRVDGYIYRNKPITVDEADKFVNEISALRTQCNNDIRILQVIEKLTRCMKTIIENTKKKIPPNQYVTASETERSVDLFPESPSDSQHGGSNTIINNSNLLSATIETVNKYKNQKSDTAVNIVTEVEDKGNINNIKSPVYNDDISVRDCSVFKVNEKNNKFKSCNFNTHRTNMNIIDVPIITNVAVHHAITNAHITKSDNTNNKDFKHLKLDQFQYSNIADKPKEIRNDGCIEKIRKYKIKPTKSIETNKKILIPLTNQTKTRKSKKKNSSEATQNPYYETLNSEATINTNVAKRIKMHSNIKKSQAPGNNVNYDLPRVTKRRNKTANKNQTKTNKLKRLNIPSSLLIAPSSCAAPNKYPHRNIDVISDEVHLPLINVDNNGVKTIAENQDLLAKKIGALQIQNERVPNDLSWIQDIRYVREINSDEFDKMPSKYNDVFWTNFSLPDDWHDVDLLD